MSRGVCIWLQDLFAMLKYAPLIGIARVKVILVAIEIYLADELSYECLVAIRWCTHTNQGGYRELYNPQMEISWAVVKKPVLKGDFEGGCGCVG